MTYFSFIRSWRERFMQRLIVVNMILTLTLPLPVLVAAQGDKDCDNRPPGHWLSVKKGDKVNPCKPLPPGIMKELVLRGVVAFSEDLNLPPGIMKQLRAAQHKDDDDKDDKDDDRDEERDEDEKAPVLSDVRVSEVTNDAFRITWKTNEPADSQIAYAGAPFFPLSSKTDRDMALVTEHSHWVRGLAADTFYLARALSRDAAGNEGRSGYMMVRTKPTPTTPDTTAPVITEVAASAITHNSAIVTWKTNEPANSQVEYGTTAALGSSTTLDAAFVTPHSQVVTGLSADTTYHFRVLSRDAAGNLTTSATATLKTAIAPDTTDPVISEARVAEVTNDAFRVTWKTNEPADSQVVYGRAPFLPLSSQTERDMALVTEHSQWVRGLAADTFYFARAVSRDAAGNGARSGLLIARTKPAPDTTAPTITSVSASAVTSGGATITWTTNEPADSQVEYGTTASFGSTTTLDTAMMTAHSQVLAGLSADTTYSFRVRSRDAAGNVATSATMTVKTLVAPAPDTTAPSITRLGAKDITRTSATIDWATDEKARADVFYNEGATLDFSTMKIASTTELALDGSVQLTNLAVDKVYSFVLMVRDAANNIRISAVNVFRTLAQ